MLTMTASGRQIAQYAQKAISSHLERRCRYTDIHTHNMHAHTSGDTTSVPCYITREFACELHGWGVKGQCEWTWECLCLYEMLCWNYIMLPLPDYGSNISVHYFSLLNHRAVRFNDILLVEWMRLSTTSGMMVVLVVCVQFICKFECAIEFKYSLV